MTRVQFHLVAALTLAALAVPTGRADETPPNSRPSNISGATRATVSSNNSTCTIYPLSELGDDAELGQWIANTIPDVIQPGTWTRHGVTACLEGATNQGEVSKRIVSYYPPSKVLVVYHTPAVQTEVAAFIANVKKALPTDRTKGEIRVTKSNEVKIEPGLAPAAFFEASAPRKVDADSLTQPPTLPTPPAGKPKHLFHFIIRYEGDGVIDSNVVELFKNYATEATRNTNVAVPAMTTPPNGVPPMCMLPPEFQSGNFMPYGICQPAPGSAPQQAGLVIGPGGIPLCPQASPIVPAHGQPQPTASPAARPQSTPPMSSGAKPAPSSTVVSSPTTSSNSHRPPATSAPVNTPATPGVASEPATSRLER